MHILYVGVLLLYGVFCVGCVFVDATHYSSMGNLVIKTPAGMVWALQIIGIVIVYWNGLNLLHLLWWWPASALAYVSIIKVFCRFGLTDKDKWL
jgi:hypothetical protein